MFNFWKVRSLKLRCLTGYHNRLLWVCSDPPRKGWYNILKWATSASKSFPILIQNPLIHHLTKHQEWSALFSPVKLMCSFFWLNEPDVHLRAFVKKKNHIIIYFIAEIKLFHIASVEWENILCFRNDPTGESCFQFMRE